MMGFGLMSLGLLLPILLVVGIAYALFNRPTQFNGPATPPENRQSALDVLKERYARGEISQEEYQEIRRNLVS